MSDIAAPSSRRNWGYALLAAAVVIATSIAGQIATFPNLGWYAGLVKPPFNPPNWIFGPVWTSLYALMAFAFWRILRLPASRERSLAIAVFAAQLVLNALWSWMFFYAHSPLLGLINVVPQWFLVLTTLALFARLDRVAGLLLVPLSGWVGFAALLNASVWMLNR